MTHTLHDILLLAAHLAGALVFLLVGWRLGRDSVSRPMFEFPLTPQQGGEAPDETDPWDEAASQADPPGRL